MPHGRTKTASNFSVLGSSEAPTSMMESSAPATRSFHSNMLRVGVGLGTTPVDAAASAGVSLESLQAEPVATRPRQASIVSNRRIIPPRSDNPGYRLSRNGDARDDKPHDLASCGSRSV